MKDIISGGVVFILFIIAVLLVSWLVTIGIIKLITICFGLKFSWLIATGIWLIMILISSIFKGNK